MSSRVRLRSVLLPLLVMAMLIALAVPGVAAKPAKVAPGTMTVGHVELVGKYMLEKNSEVNGVLIGGISGITYDPAKDVYYAVSDTKSDFRFYTLTVDPSDGTPTFLGATFIRDQRGRLPGEKAMDLEGIELLHNGQLFMSSERDAKIVPHLYRFNKNGRMNRELRVPDMFIPDVEWPANPEEEPIVHFGARENLSFESLTSTPNGRYLYTAVENALVQDGDMPTLESGTPSRVLEYRAAGLQPARQWVYEVEPIPTQVPGKYADNGLVDMQAIDNAGTFIMMERSYASHIGNTVRLFEASTRDATNVASSDALEGASYKAMSKQLLVEFPGDFGIDSGFLDNMEALTFGPTLADGSRLLVLVSDDNFNPKYQDTVFIVLKVFLTPAG